MWVIIEGVDRTGKSTLAELLVTKGFKLVHMNAPDKKYFKQSYVGPSYMDEMVEFLISLSGQDIVFDRSVYGECVHPNVYNRPAQLTEEDIEILREIESQNDPKYIMMRDPNKDMHWFRCVENKEPLTKSQFDLASALFLDVANRYNFATCSYPEIKDMCTYIITGDKSVQPTNTIANGQLGDISPNDGHASQTENTQVDVHESLPNQPPKISLSPEQRKLLEANAVNDILSSRILNKKGPYFDELEVKVKVFLNDELAKLLGTSTTKVEDGLSIDEVSFLRTLIKKARG